VEKMTSWQLNSRRVMWRLLDDRHIDNSTDNDLTTHM